MNGFEAAVEAALAGAPAALAQAARPATRRLALHLSLLAAANERFNLVSSADASPGRLTSRHLLDSLAALPLLPPPGRPRTLLDVGSGGGLPAIPLLVLRPDLSGILVESTGKKARFLLEAIEALELTARVVNARFPAPALDEMRDLPPVDLLTSRAVADAGRIVRQARPRLAPGAVAFLWTVDSLVPRIGRSAGGRVRFVPSPGGPRGIAVVECFT